ncbi:alpha-galactosidase D [Labrys sp. 22185]|uniref:alpha-galactosidase D n=1 Tax=Labrys sp. 22185 TaxID=3453888 RepID=UPI003F856E94
MNIQIKSAALILLSGFFLSSCNGGGSDDKNSDSHGIFTSLPSNDQTVDHPSGNDLAVDNKFDDKAEQPVINITPRYIPVASPTMGWASWNAHGCNISEDIIKKSADYLVTSGLKDAGYVHVNIDDCWSETTRAADGSLTGNRAFPNGMKALGDYIHSKGLKYGIYATPGPQTCAQIGGRQNTTVTPPISEAGRQTGSLGHVEQDLNSFASWGVDFLKYDWCTTTSLQADDQVSTFILMRNAINSAEKKYNKKITYNINATSHNSIKTGTTYFWGNIVDSWRTTDDIFYVPPRQPGHPAFSAVINQNFKGSLFPEAQHTGTYNDADMMVAGFTGSDLTPDNDRAHVSLWAVLGAPMVLGNDLTAGLSQATLSLLTNPEVIAVNQDILGVQALKVDQPNSSMSVYAKLLSDPGERAVVLFNNGASAANISVSWEALGLDPAKQVTVRDLWSRTDLGAQTSPYKAQKVPAGGVVMLKVKGTDLAPTSYWPSTLADGATSIDCSTCEGGKKITNLGTVSFENVMSNNANGNYIRITYLNKSSANAVLKLDIKDTFPASYGTYTKINFGPTGNESVPGMVTLFVRQGLGANKFTLSRLDDTSIPVPEIVKIEKIAGPVLYTPPAMMIEAESPNNTIGGTAKVAACATCSGGQKVGYLGTVIKNGISYNGSLTFNKVTVPTSGSYVVTFAYGTSDPAGRSIQIATNGQSPVTLQASSTGSDNTIANLQATLTLNAGSNNTIMLYNSAGWAPDIDGIVSIKALPTSVGLIQLQ